MRWDVQEPHSHSRGPADIPGAGTEGNNYCRNPDGEDWLWCYTTDEDERWEHCEPIVPSYYECMMYNGGSNGGNLKVPTTHDGVDVYIFKKCKCQYPQIATIPIALYESKELLCDPGLFVDGWWGKTSPSLGLTGVKIRCSKPSVKFANSDKSL